MIELPITVVQNHYQDYCDSCWKDRAQAIIRLVEEVGPDDELVGAIEGWALSHCNKELGKLLDIKEED